MKLDDNFIDISNNGRYAGIVTGDEKDIHLATTVVSAKWLKAVMTHGMKDISPRQRDNAEIEITLFTTDSVEHGYGYLSARFYDKTNHVLYPECNRQEKRFYAIAPVLTDNFPRESGKLTGVAEPEPAIRKELDTLAREVYKMKAAMKRAGKFPEQSKVLQAEQTVRNIYRTLADASG